MTSRLIKDKARRGVACTCQSTKPMSLIRKIEWRKAAVQPLQSRDENLLATHIRGLLDILAPSVCVQVNSAPEGFPKSAVLTTNTQCLLFDGPQMLETLRAEQKVDRQAHSKRFRQWMLKQLRKFAGEDAALLYDEITKDLAIQIFTNEMDEKEVSEYADKRLKLYHLVRRHSADLPFTKDEFDCMVDIVLTGDVENDSYDDMEANAEEQNDDKANDVRGYLFPMPLDLLLSLASGKTLSGLLLTDILPWKTVADNLHVCNESALVDLVLIFEPYIGYAQDILKHLIERELVDQHIRLVATILQRKLAIQNALWIPALMRQLLSASIDPDSNLRRYSTKSQEDIVANVIDCFKDFISPGWGTDRLFTVMQSLDNDEKWLQQLCSGKHWRAQDIEQFFGADLAKICQDQ